MSGQSHVSAKIITVVLAQMASDAQDFAIRGESKTRFRGPPAEYSGPLAPCPGSHPEDMFAVRHDRDELEAALSAACVAHGRGLAGLPPLS